MEKLKVDWHSHFAVTVPIIGWFIGVLVKKSMAKVFKTRLEYIKPS